MNKEQLKKFVQDNPKLVRARKNADGTVVLKYTKRVFYDDLWNDELEWCRGTIVDEDFNLVALPFQKIYNYGVEKKAPVFKDDELVTAYRKVNGFMVAVTWHNGDVLVSTTGSTESDYVTMAKEMMLTHMRWEDWQLEVCSAQDFTLMFECVHPNDPHIVVEKPGMYFLGWRLKSWDSKITGFGVTTANAWENFATNVLHCYSAESYVLPFGELREKVKGVQHEGFVIYSEDGRASKIKSQYYLVQKAMARKKDIMSVDKKKIDEEYFPLVDYLISLGHTFVEMDEQSRLIEIRKFLSK